MKNRAKTKIAKKANKLFDKASFEYELGHYDTAHKLFSMLLEIEPEIKKRISYYLYFCENVVAIRLSEQDIRFEREYQIYKASERVKGYAECLICIACLMFLLSFNSSVPIWIKVIFVLAGGIVGWMSCRIHKHSPDTHIWPNQKRCKYCGHYTEYIPPNCGGAYRGTNNCAQCGRGYPMPSIKWDTVEGRSEMGIRKSVNKDELGFFREKL